jgi:dynein heavy chain
MCAYGDHIFVFGGLHGLSRYTNDLHVLDTKSMEWFHVPDGGNGDVPSPRAWHSATMIGKTMVVYGGTAGRSTFHGDAYLLDTGTVCLSHCACFFVSLTIVFFDDQNH